MPYKLARPCRNTMCPNTTLDISGYCEKHRFKNVRKQDNRYYSKTWKDYIKKYIVIHNKCVACGQKSEEVDHIKMVVEGGDFWNPNNHQALCKSCHSRKTAKEVRFGRGKKTYEEIYGRKRK